MPGTTLYPGALDSHANGNPRGFAEVVNLLSTTTSGAINAAVTTIPVASTAGFPSAGIVVLRDGVNPTEVVYYAAKDATNFLSCTRGSGGTSAAIHNSGCAVACVPVAAMHNDIAAALVAVETKVGTGASTPVNKTVLAGTGAGSSGWTGSPTFSGTVTVEGGIVGASLNVGSGAINGGAIFAASVTVAGGGLIQGGQLSAGTSGNIRGGTLEIGAVGPGLNPGFTVSLAGAVVAASLNLGSGSLSCGAITAASLDATGGQVKGAALIGTSLTVGTSGSIRGGTLNIGAVGPMEDPGFTVSSTGAITSVSTLNVGPITTDASLGGILTATNVATTSTAAAGAGGAPPANAALFFYISINGSLYRVPAFN